MCPDPGQYSIIFQSKSIHTVHDCISIAKDTVQLITAEKIGVTLDGFISDV